MRYVVFVLLLIVLVLIDSSISNDDDKVILLTVIGSSSNEYGSQKSHHLKYLSIDNRLRYCIKQQISCVIGTAYTNDGNRRYLRTKLIRALKPINERSKFKNTTVYSARYLKVSWIITLLSVGVTNIVYFDEDAFIVKSFHPSDVFKYLSSTCCLGLTPDIGSSRYNTGVIFIRKCLYTIQLFKKLMEIHQQEHYITDNLSDQLVLNRILHNSNYNIQNVSRTLYNSLPIMDQPYWNLLGFQNGDETDLSYITHFAGVYGGSKIDGGSDPVIMLLTLKGAVDRHRKTLDGNEPLNIYCTGLEKSIKIIDTIMVLLNNCIPIVFRSIDNEFAENIAKDCLTNATRLSQGLLTSHTQNELKTGLLIYTPR